MRPVILVQSLNAVHNKLIVEDDIAAELSDYFTFKVSNFEFIMAQMRRKNPGAKMRWNGEIKLFSKATGKMYVGLSGRLDKWAEERGYTVIYEDPKDRPVIDEKTAREFIETLKIPKIPHYYQVDLFVEAMNNDRALALSPTASGKSLIIYLLCRWFMGNQKTLIIAPSIQLVHQMTSDFKEYGLDVDKYVHKIYEGQDKDTDKQIIISTWQSIYELPKDWFADIRMVICDEVHLAQAKSIKHIMEMLVNTKLRFGFTGTLDDTLCHRLVLEGLFGSVIVSKSSAELMKEGYLAELNIKAIVLDYPEEVRKDMRKNSKTYPEEVEYLANYTPRNKFIYNLALQRCPGNTLILFRLVEKHGKILYEALSKLTDRPVYYIHGGVEGEEREAIRQIVQTQKNAFIVGSYGTMSTAVNIPNLNHGIFASPYKSKIKVLQSIGRGLRRPDGKTDFELFDLADDLTYRGKPNHTLQHFMRRIEIYNAEDFKYKTYRVGIK